jgi:hypothetical protein
VRSVEALSAVPTLLISWSSTTGTHHVGILGLIHDLGVVQLDVQVLVHGVEDACDG